MNTSTRTQRCGRIKKPLSNPPNAIQSLRIALRLSAAELGEKIGVQQSHISRVERTGIGLSRKKWQKLAEFFGVEYYQLHDPNLLEKIPKKFAPDVDKTVEKS